MKNLIQDGDMISMVAPYAVVSGAGALVGTLFGVAQDDVANAATGVFATEAVYALACLSTDVIASGAVVYWDDTNKRCTGVALGNNVIGAAVAAKSNGQTTVTVRLNGAVMLPSGVLASTPAPAPTIASAATIAPTAPFTFVSGTVAIVTITVPAAMAAGGGRISLIPTGLSTWTAAGNIALAGSAVVSKVLDLVWDATAAKWYPSYIA